MGKWYMLLFWCVLVLHGCSYGSPDRIEEAILPDTQWNQLHDSINERVHSFSGYQLGMASIVFTRTVSTSDELFLTFYTPSKDVLVKYDQKDNKDITAIPFDTTYSFTQPLNWSEVRIGFEGIRRVIGTKPRMTECDKVGATLGQTQNRPTWLITTSCYSTWFMLEIYADNGEVISYQEF